jgi:molybdopterin synthase sulfur carrier subunit
MIIHFYATLRQVVGSRQVDVPLPPGSTLRQLIDQVVRQFPALHGEMLDPQENLYRHIHIFVNGRESSLLAGGIDTILEPSDTISIFPPVGGGSSEHSRGC